jgi:hypothetical protein
VVYFQAQLFAEFSPPRASEAECWQGIEDGRRTEISATVPTYSTTELADGVLWPVLAVVTFVSDSIVRRVLLVERWFFLQ